MTMNWIKRNRCLGLLAMLPLLSLFAGCGASHARYKPTSDEARSSLDAALSAWRDGKPYGSINVTPPVHVGDSAWQSGKQIESFQIGEEQDDGDGTKQFVVTIKMKKPASEQSVRYFVHGRDPVWVYREEDYKRMLNMDNNPAPPSSSKPAHRRSGRER
jgi:hypothetical protein